MRVCKNQGTLWEQLNEIHLKVIDYGTAQSGNEWVGNIVNPPYSRLYYITGGDPYIVVAEDGRERRIPLQPGGCYLMPVGFSFRHACETHMEQIYFHLNLTDYNGSDLLRCCPGMMECRPEPGAAERLNRCLAQDDLYNGLLLKQELCAAILNMLGEAKVKLQSVSYSRGVSLAIQYIRSHLSLQISVAELASHSFVSERALTRRFREEVGMTVGQYVDAAILLEAEQLLTKTDLTILEISERFGFCDQFYFSRWFKNHCGETPRRYRRQRPI